MAKKTLLDNIIESIKDVDGRLIKQSGTTKQMISDLNYKVVAPAKSAADSAQSTADAAIASAQVTSDAMSDIASATAEAKQGANDAMSRAVSAWAEATTATSAASSAQSSAQSAIAKTVALSTNVNVLQGTVTTLQTESTTQADEIKNKVTQSDVTGMLTGYATQDYTQSLVTQKANDWNLNLTKLQTDVNAIKTTGGGANLASGTSSEDQSYGDASQTTGWRTPIIATFDNPQAGQQYTISVNTKTNGGSWRIQVWDGTSPTNRGSWITSGNPISTQGQNTSFTFTWPSGRNQYLIVQLANSNDGGQIFWNSAMLEEGTVAHTWSPAPSDVATVTSVTNLSATVDGIKSTVATKADQSTVTELSNLVQTKVSSGDFTSTTTQLKNLINQRVQVGDVISQINQEAGGNTLIQVSNGKGSLILNADNTIITGKAWIPSAAIANLTADDITTGTLKGVDIDFRNSSGQGVLIKDSTVTFDDGASGNKAGYLSFSSMPIADWPSGTGGNELQIKYGESLAIIATGDTNSRALFSTVNTQIGYHQQGDTSANWGLTGLKIDNIDRQINLGVYGSDGKWARLLANPGNVDLNAGDAHCHLDGGKLHFYKDNDNNSPIAVELQVDGWAWVRGWVEAAGHSQHSALSTKTDLQTIDDDEMLEMVNNTDLASFLFKTDVASGETHRHIGLIIDDVHDVAQYQTPQEFIAPNGASRDDDNMIGALFGAVKALTKRIKTLESKVG